MMYSDASVSGDRPTDTTMTALYRQLDDHELGDDASFDVNAGLRHLFTRIQREVTSPEPAVITSSATRLRFRPLRPQAAGARRVRRRSLGLHSAAAAGILLIVAICAAIFLPGANAPDSVRPAPQAVPAAPSIAVWPLQLRPGQSQLSTADMKGLATEISMIKETPATMLRVIGYVSGPGTSAALAYRRAENVAGFLEKEGISASMIQVLVVRGVSPFPGTNSDTVIVSWSNFPSPSNAASPSTAPTTSTAPTPAPTPTPTPAISTVPAPTPATSAVSAPTPATSAVSTPAPATSATPAPVVSTSPASTPVPALMPSPATSTSTSPI